MNDHAKTPSQFVGHVTSHLDPQIAVDSLSVTDGVIVWDPLRLTDADEHLSGEDEQLQRWLSGGRSTLEGVVAYLRTVDQQWLDRGPIFHFAIRVPPGHDLAGTIDVQFDRTTPEATRSTSPTGSIPDGDAEATQRAP